MQKLVQVALACLFLVTSSLTQTCTTGCERLDNIRLALQFPGADFCQKVNAAAIDLNGSSGGYVDARGLVGTQACVLGDPGPLDGVTAPVFLQLGSVTVNSAIRWSIPSNATMWGLGYQLTTIHFQPSSSVPDLLYTPNSSVNNVDLGYFTVTGTGNNPPGAGKTGRLVSIGGGSNIRVHNLYVSGADWLPPSGPVAGIYAKGNDVWITDNIVTGTGPTPVNLQSYDIVAWAAGANNRIHIRNNQISNSNASQSIACYDCVDSDAIGNQLDQNNQISSTTTTGGYGIQFYASSIPSVERARIEANHVSNTAGSGIYAVGCANCAIVGNTVVNSAQQQSDVSLPVGGISLNGFDHGSVTGNTTVTSGKDGIVVAIFGYAPAASGTVINGNAIQSVVGYGIRIRGVGVDGLVISHNSIDGGASSGVSVDSGSSLTNSSIVGNLIKNPAHHGMIIYSATNCIFANNTISGLDNAYGINLRAGSNDDLHENIIAYGTGTAQGINTAGTGVKVTNNQVTDFSATGIVVGSSGIIAGNVVGSGSVAIDSSTGGGNNLVYGNYSLGGTYVTASGDTVFGNR